MRASLHPLSIPIPLSPMAAHTTMRQQQSIFRGHENSKTAVVKAVIPFVTDEAGFAAKQPPLTHFESWGGALVSPPQVLLRNKVNSGLHSPSSCF